PGNPPEKGLFRERNHGKPTLRRYFIEGIPLNLFFDGLDQRFPYITMVLWKRQAWVFGSILSLGQEAPVFHG
ncbi:MAG: hypothetical protein PHV74_15320, partial [Dehalococcoidia bacterium]|nr:hypothetical protein [Dehalococcoidia bacterium]